MGSFAARGLKKGDIISIYFAPKKSKNHLNLLSMQ